MKTNFRTMKWLLKREFWEHKSLVWIPVLMASLIAIVLLFTLFVGLQTNPKDISQFWMPNAEPLPSGAIVDAHHMVSMNGALTLAQSARFSDILTNLFIMLSWPVFFVYGICAYFYSSTSLSNERVDRSILFWRSLPFSDEQSVLSKYLFIALFAPLVAWAIATLTWLISIFILCIASAIYGEWIFGAFFMNPTIYLTPLSYLLVLPVFVVWALPVLGWLFLVSSFAKKNAQAWGFGIPLTALVMCGAVSKDLFVVFNKASFIVQVAESGLHILGRAAGGLVPGYWVFFDAAGAGRAKIDGRLNLESFVGQSWQSVAHAEVWIAAMLGILMIVLAARLRRNSGEA